MNNGSLSLLKIVGGLSRTLNIANQMIPLYKQVKPLIQNSGKVLSNLKNFANTTIKNNTTPATIPPAEASYAIPKKTYNNPTFFL